MGLNLSKIVTKMPSVRWHMADLLGKTLYSRAFGSFGFGDCSCPPSAYGRCREHLPW